MKELTTLLHEIVQHTSFEVGQTRMAGGTTVIVFDGKRDELSPAQLRQTLEKASWGTDERLRAESASIVTPEPLVVKLTEKLRELLVQYMGLDTDYIRHTLPGFISPHGYTTFERNGLAKNVYITNISNFAKGLIRGAAILGPDRVAELLRDWIRGKPLRYRTSVLLVGVTVEQELDLGNGIHVTPLPKSSDALPVSLPRDHSINARDYLGRVLLSVDSIIDPAISLVQDTQDPGQGPHVLSGPENVSLFDFYEALSLVSNSHVHPEQLWNDYGEAGKFSKSHNNIWRIGNLFFSDKRSISFSPTTGVTSIAEYTRDIDTGEEHVSLEELQKALEIHGVLNSHKKRNRRFKVAVSRWIKSTHPDLEVTDQFIELRIALEALYLDGGYGEQTFRLAIRGAWHLGDNFSQRQQIQKELKKFYSVASKVSPRRNSQ